MILTIDGLRHFSFRELLASPKGWRDTVRPFCWKHLRKISLLEFIDNKTVEKFKNLGVKWCGQLYIKNFQFEFLKELQECLHASSSKFSPEVISIVNRFHPGKTPFSDDITFPTTTLIILYVPSVSARLRLCKGEARNFCKMQHDLLRTIHFT